MKKSDSYASWIPMLDRKTDASASIYRKEMINCPSVLSQKQLFIYSAPLFDPDEPIEEFIYSLTSSSDEIDKEINTQKQILTGMVVSLEKNPIDEKKLQEKQDRTYSEVKGFGVPRLGNRYTDNIMKNKANNARFLYKNRTTLNIKNLAWFYHHIPKFQTSVDQAKIIQTCIDSLSVDATYLHSENPEIMKKYALTLALFHYFVDNSMVLTKEEFSSNKTLAPMLAQLDVTSDESLTQIHQHAFNAYRVLLEQLETDLNALSQPTHQKFSLKTLNKIQKYITNNQEKDKADNPNFKLKLYKKLQSVIASQPNFNGSVSLQQLLLIGAYCMSALNTPILHEVRDNPPRDGKGEAVREVEAVLDEVKRHFRNAAWLSQSSSQTKQDTSTDTLNSDPDLDDSWQIIQKTY